MPREKKPNQNILPVYDFGQAEGYSYLVIHYIEGARTLREVMSEPLTLTRIAALIGQIAAALDHAHVKGSLHTHPTLDQRDQQAAKGDEIIALA